MSTPTNKPAGGSQPPPRHPLNFRLQCPNCLEKNPNIHEDFTAGDLVCMSCGMVLGDRIIDTRSEWRTFSSDSGNTDDPSRVGGPSNPLFSGEQLDTMISGRDNYSGMSKDLGRLQGRATFKSGEKALLNNFKTISIMCERVGLPKVIADRAKQLFKLVEDEKILKGKGAEGAVAACIYIACREAKVPRTFKEISSLTMVPKKDIGRCCKAMAPFLERMCSPSTEDFMARFCSHLNLGMDVQKLAIFLAKKVKEIGCADGKSPITVASAGIYFVSHLSTATRKTPKDISFVSGVSEATIRNAYKDLYPFRNQLIPPESQAVLINLPPMLFEVFEAIEPDDPESALNESIDLPRIVVVGSQSSGKSSVLESLVMRDFLPRGKDIVTRRPLILQLVHRTAYMDAMDHVEFGKTTPMTSRSFDRLQDTAEWGEFGHMPDQKFYDFHLIRREIEKETLRIAGANKGISRQPIWLKIFSPRVVNLTLVDLPGITKIPVGDQPDDIEAQVRDLVYDFIAKPNSIILAVTPANQDLVNSDALKIAREVDPTGSRTIGVLTKLDLMDSGTDAMDILQNRGSFQLKLGFIGVVNRSQSDINLNKPVAEALKQESEFFKTHLRYKSLIPNCGSAFLGRELNKILLEHIREQLPALKSRINALIVSTQSELQSYGDLGLPGKANKGSLLLKLVTTFVSDFQESIQGNQRLESTSSELFGGARINQIFNEIYVEMINAINSTDDLSPADVRNAIRNSSGPRPALFVPEASFEVLTKRQISKLEVPAQRCVDLVYEELQRLANRVERKEIKRFPVLAEKLVQATNDLLRERLGPTTEMVESLVKIEMAYINTNHPDFWKSGSAISTLAKIIEEKRRKETGQLATSYSKSNEELLNSASSPTSPSVPVKPISTNNNNGKDEGGLLSYLFRAPNPPPYSRSLHGEGKRLPPSKASPKATEAPSLPSPVSDDFSVDSLNEKEEVETRLIVSLIHSYFGIVKKNLVDSVPKATMHFLVNHTVEQLPTKLVTELYREDRIDELLKEDEDVVKQRERCKAALEAYRQAATLLSLVKDSDLSKLKRQ